VTKRYAARRAFIRTATVTAQAAYAKALDETPCPLGVGNSDQYAEEAAWYAAVAAGATSDQATEIVSRLTKDGVSG